jgi:hypothetical protein
VRKLVSQIYVKDFTILLVDDTDPVFAGAELLPVFRRRRTLQKNHACENCKQQYS